MTTAPVPENARTLAAELARCFEGDAELVQRLNAAYTTSGAPPRRSTRQAPRQPRSDRGTLVSRRYLAAPDTDPSTGPLALGRSTVTVALRGRIPVG